MAKKIITRKNFIDAGIRLAKTLPLGQVTVAAICAEMGIVKSTYYRHYRSVAALFADALDNTDEVFKEIPDILMQRTSNHEKIEALYLFSARRVTELGPKVMAQMLAVNAQKDTLYSFFLRKSDYVNSIIFLIEEAQIKKEICNPSDPLSIHVAICKYGMGNNMMWAYSNGSFNYEEELRIGIHTILGTEKAYGH